MLSRYCLLIVLAASPTFACSSDSSRPELTERNNVERDAAPDGANGSDAAADMGSTDQGTADPDLPILDMSGGDPTSFDLLVDCVDSEDAVYATPISDGERGEVLGCAQRDLASTSDIETRLLNMPGIAVDTGYRSYLIAFRTQRANGEPGVSTMVLYAPQNNVRGVGSSALVVANHAGVAVPDECAPSYDDPGLAATNTIALPWIGRGFPVALPDFAGLGTEGVMGFANTHDLGYSSLDAARAARQALDGLNGRVLATGQAEGAHAAFAMQALNREYASDLSVDAVIGFASAYPRISYAELLRLGGLLPLVDGLGIARTVAALVAYTDWYNLFGAARAREVYHPDVRDYVGDAVESGCFVELLLTLADSSDPATYQPPAVLAGLIDPDVRQAAVDCLNGAAGCTPDAQAFVDRANANVKQLDPDGAPILFLTAFGGTVPNPQEQACLAEWISFNGPVPDTCLWSGANNVNLSYESGFHAVAWGEAILRGEEPPTCPGTEFPPCMQ